MMDKGWMQIGNRALPEYRKGVKTFLDFAFIHTTSNRVSCPCKRCNNAVLKTKDDVEADLLMFGIVPSYTRWIMHGENYEGLSYKLRESDPHSDDDDDIFEILEDHFGVHNSKKWTEELESNMDDYNEEPNEESSKFYRLLNDTEKELYPGCKKYSKLSFIMKLFHLKCLNHWSNKSFTLLLELLNDVLPEGTNLPNNYYETRKIIRDLGLNYSKIDACLNNCMLYWKQNANADNCSTCGESRWKPKKMMELNKFASQVIDGQLDMNEDEIFVHVFGPEKHGRVRGYGAGVTPIELFGSSTSVCELERRLAESEQRLQESEQQRKVEVQALKEQMSALENRFESRFQSMMDEMMKNMS